MMIWFVNAYVKICTFLIRPKANAEEEEFQLKYISGNMFSTSELSLMQAKQEIVLYGERVQRMFGIVKELYYEKNSDKFLALYNRVEKYENISDKMELEIANYLTKVLEGRLSSHGKESARMMLRIISEIESVADSCNNLAKAIKRKNDGKAEFIDSQNESIEHMFSICDRAIGRMNELLNKSEQDIVGSDIALSENIENEINNYRKKLKNDNLENIDTKKYTYQDGIYYMDIVSECEKLGDYVINIVQSVVKEKI
jgi:Na+/phosphate symporter